MRFLRCAEPCDLIGVASSAIDASRVGCRRADAAASTWVRWCLAGALALAGLILPHVSAANEAGVVVLDADSPVPSVFYYPPSPPDYEALGINHDSIDASPARDADAGVATRLEALRRRTDRQRREAAAVRSFDVPDSTDRPFVPPKGDDESDRTYLRQRIRSVREAPLARDR